MSQFLEDNKRGSSADVKKLVLITGREDFIEDLSKFTSSNVFTVLYHDDGLTEVYKRKGNESNPDKLGYRPSGYWPIKFQGCIADYSRLREFYFEENKLNYGEF